ncbi:MAG: translation initiation factor IF-2 [Oscillospiraceae bacterium]|nr:translation initiation factor IF-2 [Oscillospiraceae bacterium]
MSTMFKYRVHEVAKDFNVPTKTIAEILTKYATAPKNHMQVLTVQELDIIFQYLTVNNQIDSIEEIYKVEAPKPAPEPKKEDAPRPVDAKTGKPVTPAAPAAPVQPARTDNPAPKQAPKAEKEFVARKAPEKRVIDTSGATINIAKYDDRLDKLVPDRAENMRHGKEKFGKKNQQRPQTMASSAKRRAEERDRMQRLQFEIAKKAPLKVAIPDEIAVGELASRMKKSGADVVKRLIKLGVMASISDIIDYETAALVAIEFNCKVEHEVVVTIEDKLLDLREDTDEELRSRAPVVVVMGHVDHGKTSLLDRIRAANVASGEAGGITQHIGAYSVSVNGSPITFLDTPGHEAFTAMRARGAMVTDIAILIVAADDGIMPQTVESINHAKAAGIPIIVAINKIDMPGANPEKIKQQLTEHGLLSDEWGGDTIICEISAKTGEGIDKLLEMVVLTAEMGELRANPDRLARGTVIEARIDKGRGPIMTVLVQNGTLKQGDIIIAGTSVGHVRVMTNDKGERVEEAGPSVPVEIAGMSEVPEAGEPFNAVSDERMARELAEERRSERKNVGVAEVKVSLDDLFTRIQQGEVKDLNIIVKADVQGSAEAIKTSLEKLSGEEVRVVVIHSAVGAINESDVMLAATSGAIIVGFNVRPDNSARDSAVRSGVDIRLHSIIYDCIQEIEVAIRGMQAPKFREVVYGHAEVRQVIKVSNVGTVCGSYVQDGKIVRGCQLRVIRDNTVIYTGALGSLRRFKDDVREVATNYECGISIEKYNDVREGDILEAFAMEEIKD